MPAVRVEKFGGSIPRVEEHLLGKEQAGYALDARLDHGSVDAWREPRLVHASPSGTYTAFCLSGCWLDFPTCVDIAQSNVTCTEHLFVTGHGDYPERLVLDTEHCTVAAHRLGLPCPETPPSVAYGAGGADKDNIGYSYAYQYENAFGERSALSPGSAVTLHPDGSSNVVSGWAVPAASWGVAKVRIYRSVSAVGGSMAKLDATNVPDTTWMFVGDAAVGAASLTDASYADALFEAVEEDVVRPPPEDLQGMVWFDGMNILAGYVGNKVYLSEPHNYHNWATVLTLDDNVCGLCASGGVLYAATDGSPYVITPAPGGSQSATAYRIPVKQPSAACGNRHMAALPDGAVYSAHDGLVKLSGRQLPLLLTAPLYAPDDWQALRPHSVLPCLYGDKLFVFAEAGAFTLNAQGADRSGWNLDFHTELSDRSVRHAFTNRAGDLFLLKADGVHQWNRGTALRPYQWHTPVFRLPRPLAFAAIRAVVERGFLDVQVYVDDAQVYDDTMLRTDNDVLPMWAVGHDWQIRVRGTGNLSYLSLATSMKEL